MNHQEIERKFLVRSDEFLAEAVSSHRLCQGYLCTDTGRTVRVRIADGTGWITIKGKSNESGTSRSEWEYEIPLADAEGLLEICTGKIIDKTRYIVPAYSESASPAQLRWEVDVFHGAHEGLVLAEIELPSEDCPFVSPSWLGDEVTGDRSYYNSQLSR